MAIGSRRSGSGSSTGAASRRAAGAIAPNQPSATRSNAPASPTGFRAAVGRCRGRATYGGRRERSGGDLGWRRRGRAARGCPTRTRIGRGAARAVLAPARALRPAERGSVGLRPSTTSGIASLPCPAGTPGSPVARRSKVIGARPFAATARRQARRIIGGAAGGIKPGCGRFVAAQSLVAESVAVDRDQGTPRRDPRDRRRAVFARWDGSSIVGIRDPLTWWF